MSEISLGFSRLAERYKIQQVQPLFTRSVLGGEKRAETYVAAELRTWPQQYMPVNTFRGDFEFGLKYERLNFEFFSRLFYVIDPEEVIAWVKDSPTGAYARRTAFLYEWFTGRVLDLPDTPANVGYVDAIDPALYLTATKAANIKRWKVRDNLAGTRAYCPLVYLGSTQPHDLYNVGEGVKQLDRTYGADLLMRSAVWLTLKESRASFAIEHEADQDERVKRFAFAIGELSGRMEAPLANEGLGALQKAILGDTALRLGVRQSPVFVGQSGHYGQLVHYVAPMPSEVQGMLQGLRDFEAQTRGGNSVARAAAVSFAFVYLHPLSDGNGRVHRFLLNHFLAADGAVPKNIVIPVSATIEGTPKGRADYDDVLESFSKPFMRRMDGAYAFEQLKKYPDGVMSDFTFWADEDALHAWRYLDLSRHVRYVSELLRQTVEQEMAQEATTLRDNDAARKAIKRYIELPDADADRIILSLRMNDWRISGKLRRDLPEIFEMQGQFFALKDKVVEAVRGVFMQQDHDER